MTGPVRIRIWELIIAAPKMLFNLIRDIIRRDV